MVRAPTIVLLPLAICSLWLIASQGMSQDGCRELRIDQRLQECVTFAESALTEIRPAWEGKDIAAYVDSVERALREAVDDETRTEDLAVLRREMAFLLTDLPAQIDRPSLLKMLCAEARWRLSNCLLRHKDPARYECSQGTIRRSVECLLERVCSQLRDDWPWMHPVWIELAATKCKWRCLELADRGLAPILKPPLGDEWMDDVWAKWLDITQGIRSRSKPTIGKPDNEQTAESACQAVLRAIWMNAEAPQYVRDALVLYQQSVAQDREKSIEAAAARGRLESEWLTKLETVEHGCLAVQFALGVSDSQSFTDSIDLCI